MAKHSEAAHDPNQYRLGDDWMQRLQMERAHVTDLGYPPLGLFDYPRLPDQTLDYDTFIGRTAFIAWLYAEAPNFIRGLHQFTFVAYQELAEQGILLSSEEMPGRLLQPPLRFPDLERQSPELAGLKQALLDWLDNRPLWLSWFIDFALSDQRQ